MAELVIDEKIDRILELEAQRRGVGKMELIRWVLGSWAIGELQQSFATPRPIYTSLAHGETAGAGAPAFDVVQLLPKLMQMGSAMMGSLTCARCTQKLSMADVQKGCCAKCEAPIE
ncbi:MAG: hypothetical protein U1B30_15650 [Pseudomonadota bacterium]|nr:hypothetical protein [Pseudomonadota bacterium]